MQYMNRVHSSYTHNLPEDANEVHTNTKKHQIYTRKKYLRLFNAHYARRLLGIASKQSTAPYTAMNYAIGSYHLKFISFPSIR